MASQQTARRLEEVTQELQSTKTAVTDSQLDTVASGIQAAKAEGDAAEKDYIAAFEAGDAPAMARAQRKMATAEARVQRLEEAKGDLEEIKTAKPQKTEARTEPRQNVDRVEQFASQMSPKSAAWIRSHPECVTDNRKNARMLAAHNLAVADDIAIDSDEYFQRIEAGVSDKQAAKVEAKPEVKPDTSGKRPMSGAASGANSSGGMNGGVNEVRLSAREVTAANDGTICHNYDDPKGKFKKGDPIGTAEFARRKMIMKRDGLYDKSVTE
jgi:chemotaxis protein histidine kinase CheA